MVLTTYLAKEFEHTQEREMFSELVSKLKPVFKDSEGVLVGNFSCEGEEIDAALFKDDAIIIIEMKDYSGKIEGGEEGVWKAGGTELKNPYQQARKYKFALLKKLDKEKEQIFGRQKLESIDLGHISTVIVFRGDIEYNKKEQMPGKTWIWFFVTDIKRVNEQIRQITSPKLRTMVSEREKILKVLRIEDSMIYYKDYRTRIKKTWEKIEKKPDDFETAKEANRVFKEILEETNDDELKLICRHGIALTTENRTDCITILLSIYNEVKDYIGYGKHKLLNDIFTEYEQYFHWEGDEFRDKLLKLFYKLKQNNQIKEIRELFFTDTDTTDKLNLEVGEFLLENNPDDTEVLEIMVINYYLPTYLLGKGDESSRLPIEKLLLKKPEFVEFIIEGELGFPESDFVEIIEKLKQTNAVPLPKLNTWLADFFWMEFSLEISKEKETWMSIGKLYLEAIDEAHQHNMDDKEYLYNALSWFNLHVGIDEKKLKAEQDISFVKECRNITENIS
ncbi:MAG: NERD domain-containing protein, partial [Nanoarchaeota archaeon]|nr:NERD domain-containing protein [Nanoarchaeota archaeon]